MYSIKLSSGTVFNLWDSVHRLTMLNYIVSTFKQHTDYEQPEVYDNQRGAVSTISKALSDKDLDLETKGAIIVEQINTLCASLEEHNNVKLWRAELIEQVSAARLKERRTAQQISQSELAEKAGVSLRMLKYYEQGYKDINKAQGGTLYKLAQALSCRVEDILEIEKID